MHAAGTFCWTELMTTDVAKAKTFYANVLGWKYKEVPMPGGAGGNYVMPQIGGKDAAGMSNMDPQQRKTVPPHWGLYVSVTDVDASYKKATEIGGKGLMPPFDIPNVGRMAVLQDPTGAVISLWWQKGTHEGFGVDATSRSEAEPSDESGARRKAEGPTKGGQTGSPANGAFCWGELMTDNLDRAQSFYSKLFGWSAKASDFEGNKYVEWVNAGKEIGGMMPIPPNVKMPPAWMAYFSVPDVDKAAESAKKSGGTIHMGPMDVANVGRMATIADPQGAVFNVIKMFADHK